MVSSEGHDETPSPYRGCDHSGITTLRIGSPEFEFDVAKWELARGENLSHGMYHLAELISFEPSKLEWLDLLEQYLASSNNPESLLPNQKDRPYYANEAIRAYIWQKQSRLSDAVLMLYSVAHARPDSKYLDAWCLNWLEPAGMLESLPEQMVWQLFVKVIELAEAPGALTLNEISNMKRWSVLAERYAARSKNRFPSSLMIRVGILRRAEELAKAEQIAKAVLSPKDKEAALCLGLIYRDQGKTQDALLAFELAQKSAQPDDHSGWLEAGDMYLSHEDWKSALKCYEKVLNREAKHAWANPSARFCAWMISSNSKHAATLIELAEQGNQRARWLYFNQEGDLMEPPEATCDTLRQLRALIEKEPSKVQGDVTISLTCIESPSNTLAFELEMAALKHDAKLVIEPPPIPTPDPRVPIADIKYSLWVYEGTDAKPGLPPPSHDVVEAIEQLAISRRDTQEKWGAASKIAKSFGAARAHEFLALMVHPPAMPKRFSAMAWLPRVQYLAAMVLAQVDGGWDNSIRRETLLSVLFGPRDWATLAAIRALTRIGLSERIYSYKIQEAFETLSKHRPDFGDCVWELALYENWLRFPDLSNEVRTEFTHRLSQLRI